MQTFHKKFFRPAEEEAEEDGYAPQRTRKHDKQSQRAYKGLTSRKPRYKQEEEVFKCRHCHQFVCPPTYGTQHRNHCPFCLFSRHVDEKRPGDRMSTCGASMEPIGYFQRPNEEYVIVHRCFGCDFERFNRIAADDDFDLILSLPELPPRSNREIKAQRVKNEIGEEIDMSDIA